MPRLRHALQLLTLATHLALVLSVAFWIVKPSPASATHTYLYTGNNFDVFADDSRVPGEYTTSMSVTGFIVLDAPLGPNLPGEILQAASLLSRFPMAVRRSLTRDPYSTALSQQRRTQPEILNTGA